MPNSKNVLMVRNFLLIVAPILNSILTIRLLPKNSTVASMCCIQNPGRLDL